jgi:hypothetical protein
MKNETELCSDQQNPFHVIWERKCRTALSKTNFVRMNWADGVKNTEVLHTIQSRTKETFYIL